MNIIQEKGELLSIQEASSWASSFLNRLVTESNISYLIQYGRIRKIGRNGTTQVFKHDLIQYYQLSNSNREINWKKSLGNDLNWSLSFEQYRESETTKHVHRLHPYKGKFIPQLVEYFLDNHTDTFKKQTYFDKGDIVLDPFCGSGTTLVQASELGIHAIGIDISVFNALISNIKIRNHDINLIKKELKKITKNLEIYLKYTNINSFEDELAFELNKFNSKYFPSPDFKYRVRQKQIEEIAYGKEKEREFQAMYHLLLKKYDIQLDQGKNNNFLDKWYLQTVREEINFLFEQVKQINEQRVRELVTIILSRTIRSCRATTHSDLATLKEPQTGTYYCKKHGKICKPIFSIKNWWKRYTQDTLRRIEEFERMKTDTKQVCLTGDSRNIDILEELNKLYPDFTTLIKKQKIKGVFSSPPYVGLIDYHDQHAYAYDLFGFARNDAMEIGPLYKGQGIEARKSYIEGISEVLLNSQRYMIKDFSIFLVANDKYALYPEIAKRSNLKIVEQFKRPVLNRTEKDKGAYSETIFHLKSN